MKNNENNLNRRQILAQFDEYVREDYQLNYSMLNDREWVNMLYEKAMYSIKHQFDLLKIYPSSASITVGRIDFLINQLKTLKDTINN